MCILFLYVNSQPNNGQYKLILASNRDEYYGRKTLDATCWQQNGFVVYSGRDNLYENQNGTWLALSLNEKQIKIGALLNVSNAKIADAKTRGHLVTDFVTNNETPKEYLFNQLNAANVYSGYHLILTEFKEDSVSCVHNSNVSQTTQNLTENEAHVFGNLPPMEQTLKARNGREIFQNILNENVEKALLIENLLNMLKSRQTHWPDEVLEKRTPALGQYLSSIFVDIPEMEYGTRTHTIILIDWNNQMDYYEETLKDYSTNDWHRSHFIRQLLLK